MLLLKDNELSRHKVETCWFTLEIKALVNLLLMTILEIETLITQANLHFKPIRCKLFQRFRKKSWFASLGDIQ